MPQAEFEKFSPFDPLYSTRIALSCRDSDGLPRVENAGGFETHENGMELQVMHNGIRVIKDAYRGKMVTDMTQYLRGVHEPQEEKVFAEVLPYMPRGATMIEIGANWAFYSLWFNKSVPEARNFCIEPDLNSLQLGINHFILNNAFAVFMQAGVKCETNRDYAQPTIGDSHVLMPFHGNFNGGPAVPGPRRAIPMITVDSLMKDFELPFIDLLHMDIQLAEVDLLRASAKCFLEKKVGYVFVSTHNTPTTGPGPELDKYHDVCLRMLRDEYGYHIVAEHNMSDAYSNDGLIVAKIPGHPGPDHVHVSKLSQSDFALTGW